MTEIEAAEYAREQVRKQFGPSTRLVDHTTEFLDYYHRALDKPTPKQRTKDFDPEVTT